MQHNYHIDPEKGIITHTFRGEVYVEDWEQAYLKCISDPNYHPVYNALLDMRDGRVKNEPEEMMRFFQLIKKNQRAYGIKHALLVITPHETAMATFYQEFSGISRNVKIFSTYEAAVEWLGV